jgi:hypothetical protein
MFFHRLAEDHGPARERRMPNPHPTDERSLTMLPLPPIRITPKRSMRDWIKRVDSYTLWAFNPDILLSRRGSATPTANVEQRTS